MQRITPTTALVGVAAVGLGLLAQPGPATAHARQDRDGRQQQQQRDREQEAERRQQEQSRGDRDRTRRQDQPTLDWEASYVVGYDLDGDGLSDVYYLASSYEIERMRRQAETQQRGMSEGDRQRMREHHERSRQKQEQRAADRGRRVDDRDGEQAEAKDRMRTVRGTIRGARDFDLSGLDEPRTVARVETDQGSRVAVVLGPRSRFEDVELRQGMPVTLRVRKGRIDNRHVLVADRVSIDGRTMNVDQPRIEDLRRIAGEVVSRRTAELQTADGRTIKHLMLKVRNRDGQVRIVSLGPAPESDARRLQKGERVTVLASPTRVNGHTVYTARKINHRGQSKDLGPYRAKGMERASRDRSDGDERMDRGERDRRSDRSGRSGGTRRGGGAGDDSGDGGG